MLYMALSRILCSFKPGFQVRIRMDLVFIGISSCGSGSVFAHGSGSLSLNSIHRGTYCLMLTKSKKKHLYENFSHLFLINSLEKNSIFIKAKGTNDANIKIDFT
jgi:hypothetical protein